MASSLSLTYVYCHLTRQEKVGQLCTFNAITPTLYASPRLLPNYASCAFLPLSDNKYIIFMPKYSVSRSSKALFLDRDGTLIVHRPYLSNPAEVELLPGVGEVLARAIKDGFLLFLFTNQSGVGRGLFSMRDVEACNERLFELLRLPRPGFTEVCVAPESPHEPSRYRKPSPNFVLEMITKYHLSSHDSWMIGDSMSDVHAGLNAGIRAALVNAEHPVDFPTRAWHCADVVVFFEKLTAGS